MNTKKISNLKDFIKLYSQKKSHSEISQMLDIPLDQIKFHQQLLIKDK